ncbi:MAG: Spy/CpxP family protein refolding chaperone [Acidobacteria bacterium]|nr:Spy/CpxP family protein refolding chaperone [Acidobacteriota bacterium]
MNRRFVTRMAAVVAVALGAVGLMAQGVRQHGGMFDFEGRANFIAGYLGLTDAQKAQAKEIFGPAKAEFEQGRGQVQSAREALEKAVKSNASDVEIERAAAALGALHTQHVASMAKRFAKFYTILTPEQKEKAEALRAQMKERVQGMIGRL